MNTTFPASSTAQVVGVDAGDEAAGFTGDLGLDELEVIIERGQQLRWGWSLQHGHRVMDAAAVAGAIAESSGPDSSPTGDVPTNEWQARAMLANLTPAEREQVRRGTAMPETVARMVETPPRDRVTDPYLPRRAAEKMLPNLLSQLNGTAR